MTRIEIPQKNVNTSPENLFSFLSDFRNYQEIMPPDMSSWEASENECKFRMNPAPFDLELKMGEKIAPKHIEILPGGESPFPFSIHISINEAEGGKSSVSLLLEAEMNMFVKMMVEKPLRHFLEFLATKTQEKF